jgi:hypothetical protein
VRQQVSGRQNRDVQAELDLRPTAGTVVVIVRPTARERCDGDGMLSLARYDAPISQMPDAKWAHMCETCYLANSTRQLGVGHGRYLMTEAEVPAPVWTAFLRACAYWKRRGAS